MNTMHRVGLLALLIALMSGLYLVGCNSGAGSTENPAKPMVSSRSELQPFASAQAMEEYLKQALVNGGATAVSAKSGAMVTTDMSFATAENAANFTTTNLQEAGVDEADHFKSDGRHFYILGRAAGEQVDSLRIRRLTSVTAEQAAANAGSTLIAQLALPAEFSHSRAYLANSKPGNNATNNDAINRPDILLALAESGRGYYSPLVGVTNAMARDWFMPWHWANGKTELQWVNITEPTSPSLSHRVSIDGYYVASRRIGETLYLVTRYTPAITGFNPYPANTIQQQENQQRITDASLRDLLPKWSLDGVEQGSLVEANTCYQPSGVNAEATADLVVVSAINLANPAAPPRSQCLTGASEAIYVSNESLYLATARQGYTVNVGTQVARYPNEAATDIHKFSLAVDGPRYRGSGSVAGHLGWEQGKKSFRMGEYQGVLRIATSLGQDWDGSATTRLTLLHETEGKLSVLSELPNAQHPAAIGKPGERLYAARFVGNRAYMVTFRVTDPLYVFDLSQPSNPRLIGELAIPGYSDYLHPLGENWLIGVGKDALPDTSAAFGDGRGAWYQGVKVALFDVRNPAQPKEVNSMLIGKRGSDSAVLHDHHAFTLLVSGNETGVLARLALPIARHSLLPSGGVNADNPNTWYEWSDTGLHLFSVLESGLVQQGEIIAESRATHPYPVANANEDRAFMNGSEIHYLHGQEMWAKAW